MAPCNIPVNGTNLPLAVQQRKAKILPKPNIKLPNNIFFALLNCKYEIPIPNRATNKNSAAPRLELNFHSFNQKLL
jgi:hypothetical protein